jgi:hypothetical protein
MAQVRELLIFRRHLPADDSDPATRPQPAPAPSPLRTAAATTGRPSINSHERPDSSHNHQT